MYLMHLQYMSREQGPTLAAEGCRLGNSNLSHASGPGHSWGIITKEYLYDVRPVLTDHGNLIFDTNQKNESCLNAT